MTKPRLVLAAFRHDVCSFALSIDRTEPQALAPSTPLWECFFKLHGQKLVIKQSIYRTFSLVLRQLQRYKGRPKIYIMGGYM